MQFILTQRRPRRGSRLPAAAEARPTTLAWQHFQDGKLGTVFGGVPKIGVTIDELLAREGKL